MVYKGGVKEITPPLLCLNLRHNIDQNGEYFTTGSYSRAGGGVGSFTGRI